MRKHEYIDHIQAPNLHYKLTLERPGPHEQGSHQNTLIIEPKGAFFICFYSKAIHQTF